MRVLLILNKTFSREVRIFVRLHQTVLQQKVERLLHRDRRKEAFDLIVSKAQVEAYIPPGAKPLAHADLTFVEDMV